MHHGCTGEKYFAPTCANVIHSPHHQTWPRHESWCAPDSPPHHGCRGKTFFARTCAFDAPSTTRCDRAPAMRRRTMDVRAKYISPVRAPTISIRPTIKHRRTINRGARPIRSYTTVVRAKNISPLRAPTMSICPTIKHRHAINRGARIIKQPAMDVRAKNISPLRAPMMSDQPRFARACALGASPQRRAP